MRAVRAAKRQNLAATLPQFTSQWTGACTRLMQIQMATLFFYSAISKLGGDDWWYGDAIWYVFTTDEHYSPLLLHIFASQYWLVNVGTYGTILIELGYVFLIWQRATRPYLLALALFLHSQFALLMGLYLFLLRHDDGPYELRAAGVAGESRPRLEEEDRPDGNDL